MNVEVIGYIATAFVLASFMVSDLRVLRVVNILGGIGWMVYGTIMVSSSIFIGNLLMVLIHMYKLHKENNKEHNNESN